MQISQLTYVLETVELLADTYSSQDVVSASVYSSEMCEEKRPPAAQ